MRRVNYKDIEELADDMMDYVLNNKNSYISAIVKYDKAKELLNYLAHNYSVTMDYLKLESVDFDGYNKEFSVYLNDDFELSCEKIWHEDNEYYKAGYYNIENDVCYVDSESYDDIASSISDCTDVVVFIVGKECNCKSCNDKCAKLSNNATTKTVDLGNGMTSYEYSNHGDGWSQCIKYSSTDEDDVSEFAKMIKKLLS